MYVEGEIEKVANELLDTIYRKNRDYGNSVFKASRFSSVPASDAILVRLGDKVNRLENLKDRKAEVDESFDDTIKDLAGYCILYLVSKNIEGYFKK